MILADRNRRGFILQTFESSFMSYAPPRRVVRKKKKDYTALIIVVLAVVALPALGYGVYTVLNKPPEPVAEIVPAANGNVKPSRYKQVQPPAPGTQSGENPYVYTPPKSNEANPYAATNSYSTNSYSTGGGGASGATEKACKKLQDVLELKKGLVVWLFDRTPSADTRRTEVLQSLKALYPTLVPEADKKAGIAAQEAKLLSVVGAFGSDAEFLTTDPVAGDEAVLKAIEGIKSGSDGNIENTFRAVSQAITKYGEYSAPPHLRNVSIIVVTDEAGNDQAIRDSVVEQAKKAFVSVSVIGSGAEFGSDGAMASGPEGTAVIRGPESHDIEAIKLDTGSSMGMMGSQETSIGPYALAALCQETNGEYLVCSSMSGGVQLPAKYYPKYMPEAQYQTYLAENKAMQALIAASKLAPAKQISGPRTSFEADENGLARTADLDAAQRPPALIKPGIDELFEALKKGEADRAKLVEPRQQAAFDLAIGRVMAAKVRTEGYIVLLAAFKAGRKGSKPGPVLWRLEPADGIEKNSVLENMAKKARTYLQGVVDNHPNTPWAQQAQQELSQPIGWKWVES